MEEIWRVTSEEQALATSFAQASETISGDLIAHVREIHKMAVDKISSRQYADLLPLAVPAYILAVTAVEAFVNEVFLSHIASLMFGKSVLSDDSAEKLELRVKLILLPYLVFGCTLPKGEQPYQDMDLLVKLRNELVHYKMNTKPPKVIKQLADRKIVVGVPAEEQPWTRCVGTLEGIRWAHNTACKTVEALVNLAPPEKQQYLAAPAYNFQLIP